MFIKPNAQDSALEQILKLIQHKEIFPGTRLFETDLEKILEMSRTPIRGALDQMVVDGILQKNASSVDICFPSCLLPICTKHIYSENASKSYRSR